MRPIRWGYQLENASHQSFDLVQDQYFVPYLPVRATPRDSHKYYVCGRPYFEDLYADLRGAQQSIYLTGLHFMRDFGLVRPEQTPTAPWQPGHEVVVTEDGRLIDGRIAAIASSRLFYDIDSDAGRLCDVPVHRIRDRIVAPDEAARYTLGNVLYDLARERPELKIYLLVNQFWDDEHLLNFQLHGREKVKLGSFLTHLGTLLPDAIKPNLSGGTGPADQGPVAALLDKLFDARIPGTDFVKKTLAHEGGLLPYVGETWNLFARLAGLPNVVCRTATHGADIFHSHHQKTIVIDHKLAYYGGIDATFVDGDRWDTPGKHLSERRHQLGRAEKFWHDIGARSSDPGVVGFFVENIFSRWRSGQLRELACLQTWHELERFLADGDAHLHAQVIEKELDILCAMAEPGFGGFIISRAASKNPGEVPYLDAAGQPLQPFAPKEVAAFDYEEALHRQAMAGQPAPELPLIQIVRSMPEGEYEAPAWNKARSQQLWQADPELAPYNLGRQFELRGWEPERTEANHTWGNQWEFSAKESYLTGIRLARHYIYFENQWIADVDIWKALWEAARRHENNPDFRMMLVLPTNPLAAANYGVANTLGVEALENRSQSWFVAKINELLGPERFGLFSSDQVYAPQDFERCVGDILRHLQGFCGWTDPEGTGAAGEADVRFLQANQREHGFRLWRALRSVLDLLEELAGLVQLRDHGQRWYSRHLPRLTAAHLEPLLVAARRYALDADDLPLLIERMRANMLKAFDFIQKQRATPARDADFAPDGSFLSILLDPSFQAAIAALPANVAQVYIHSKALIVDDIWALVGSANAGGISLHGCAEPTRPDTEIASVILDAGEASLPRKLAREMWRALLGDEPGDHHQAFTLFKQQAQRDTSDADEHEGKPSFVNPHTLDPSGNQAAKAPAPVGNPLPEQMEFEVRRCGLGRECLDIELVLERPTNLREVFVEYWSGSTRCLAERSFNGRQRVAIEPGMSAVSFPVPNDLLIASSLFDGAQVGLRIKVYPTPRTLKKRFRRQKPLFASSRLWGRRISVPRSYFEYSRDLPADKWGATSIHG